MKRLFVAIMSLIFAFSAIAFAGCTDKNANRYSLPDVVEGETFEITLDSPYNDGGWRWSYEINSSSGIEEVSCKFIPNNPDPEVIGSPGKQQYTFKAIEAGSYKIKFIYERSWEPGTSREGTNIYQIKVVKPE